MEAGLPEPVTGTEKVAGMISEPKPGRSSLGLQRNCHP